MGIIIMLSTHLGILSLRPLRSQFTSFLLRAVGMLLTKPSTISGSPKCPPDPFFKEELMLAVKKRLPLLYLETPLKPNP